MAILRGSLIYVCPDNDKKEMECLAYFISSFPGDKTRSLIVVEIDEYGEEDLTHVPCICPTELIDPKARRSIFDKRRKEK